MMVIGRILIWVAQQPPLPKKIEQIKFFKYLKECSLCLGVWIFWLLSFVMKVNFLELLGFPIYVPVVSELITGAISSFLVFIFVLGWKARFDVVVL
jgi:uncharacterized membrane protein